MKKQILLLTLLTAIISAKAQFNVYHPFPDSNAFWMEGGNHFCPPSSDGAYTLEYMIRADTTINGHIYQILSEGDWDQCNGFPIAPLVYYAKAACIREDTGKLVYICCALNYTRDSTEQLLYDFNVKVGDRLPPNYLDQAGDGGNDTVTKIDSIWIGTSYRRQFTVKYINWDGMVEYDSIVEGMGSWNGLLGPIGPSEFGDDRLKCFKHNNDSIGTCGYIYLNVNTVQKQPTQFSIYPNPASSQTEIMYQLPTGENTSILKLYNEIGQLISDQNISSAKGTMNEDVSALPNGIYYYTLSVNGVVEATNKLVIIH